MPENTTTTHRDVTGVWLSPDGQYVAIRFRDGAIGIESHGGSASIGASRVTADEISSTWRPLYQAVSR